MTLYGYGNGDDAEEEGPERRRDGREHRERKCDKACRCSRAAWPLGASLAQHPSLAPGRDVHDGNSRIFEYLTRRSCRVLTKSL
jgi:hypothetical protein